MVYRLPVIIISLVFSSTLFAVSNLSPLDHDYMETTSGNYNYIYSKDFSENEVTTLVQKNNSINQVYESSFNWKLDETVDLVLASPKKNQIVSGFATVVPNHLTTFYGGGAHVIDKFAITSWMDTLLVHEIAHFYQLNPKKGFGKFMDSVFGNHLWIPAVVIWAFPSPNMLMHQWLLEGNAVFNESRFGIGGRLYSGEYRALFYSLVKADALSFDRIINSHLEFPFGTEKYIVGGYFFLFLAEKFGIDRVNQIFVEHSGHYFNPFLINNDFLARFGVGYYDLIAEFLATSMVKAASHNDLSDEGIASSMRHQRVTKTANEATFLVEDGYSPREMVKINLTDLTVKKSRTSLYYGPVFSIDKKDYTLTSAQVDHGDTVYGLFDDSETLLETSGGKYISVIDREGNWLYHDVTSSYHSPKLVFKDSVQNSCNSLGVVDSKSNVYCFGTVEKNRVMYKNGKELFRIKGYYSKVVDVVGDDIYFIGSTEGGSTLFQFSKGKFYRPFNYDSIIDAVHLKENSFLVVNQQADKISYHILTSNNVVESPANYEYFFEKDKLYVDSPLKNRTPVNLESGTYNSLLGLDYSGFLYNLTLKSSSIGYDSIVHDIKAKFIDPTNKNSLDIEAEIEKTEISRYSKNEYTLLYQNDAYKLAWITEFTYYDRNLERYFLKDWEWDLIVRYPFFKYNTYSLYTMLFSSFDKKNSGVKTVDPGVKLILNKSEKYPLALMSYRKMTFEVGIKCEYDCNYKSKNVKTELSFDLYRENILGLHGEYVDSEYFTYEFSDVNSDYNYQEEDFDYFSPNLQPIKGIRYGASFQSVLNTKLYFSTFPISIRRAIPKVFYTGYDFKNHSFYEYGAGLGAELLFGYRIPIVVGIYQSKRKNYLNSGFDKRIGFTLISNN